MKRNKEFNEYSNKELAESFVFPVKETEHNLLGEKIFWAERQTNIKNLRHNQVMMSKLLQMKFQMEDYINDNTYDENLTFGFFLKEYISNLSKKNKDFAEEIDIEPVELSQMINKHRKPSEKIMIRLELHSNNYIPAITWYRISEKEKEFELMHNSEIRNKEISHVKNKLEISF